MFSGCHDSRVFVVHYVLIKSDRLCIQDDLETKNDAPFFYKYFVVRDENNKKCKLVILQFSNPFLCIISTLKVCDDGILISY
jgi:hypothetical protein